MNWLDLIGWAGSALLVWSLLQTRILRLRVYNLIGCFVLIFFNAAIQVWPKALAIRSASASSRVAWRSNGRPCVRVRFVMDSTADTAELTTALRRWAAGHDGATVTTSSDEKRCPFWRWYTRTSRVRRSSVNGPSSGSSMTVLRLNARRAGCS